MIRFLFIRIKNKLSPLVTQNANGTHVATIFLNTGHCTRKNPADLCGGTGAEKVGSGELSERNYKM
jgi:hypothetical protein